MKKLILGILIVCFVASVAWGNMMMGANHAAGGTCATQTAYDTGVTADSRERVYEYGGSSDRYNAQTFDPAQTGNLYSVTLDFDTIEANQDLTIRVSTNATADCRADYVEETVAVTTGDSDSSFEIVFDPQIALTSGNTASICWTSDGSAGSEDFWVDRDASSPTYASGQSYDTGVGGSWDLSSDGEATEDVVVGWKICD